MTSTASSAFVHARLADGRSRIVGEYRVGNGFGTFAYAASWVRDRLGGSFPLHPDTMPLTREVFPLRVRGGLGPLADSTPDRWGRRLIAATRALAAPPANGAEWLLATGDDRVGCLAFSETPATAPVRSAFGSTADLPGLAAAFTHIERGEPADAHAEQLYRAGASLGGVRPKATVEHDGRLWIAKFQRTSDEFDQCGAENAAMRLAADCGIDAAPTRLDRVGPRNVVLVERFDRAPGPPFHPTGHYLSALGALDLDDTSLDGSYPRFAEFLHRHSADQRRDRAELFRRMVFNVLVGNRDDHLKNHAVIHRPGAGWRLTPAFDVLPQPDMDPWQAISVGAHGTTATIDNCLSRCGDFGLHEADARSLIACIVDRVRGWRSFYAGCGVDERTIARLGRAFSPTLDAADR